MFRRIVALALWTYFGWYLGAMLAAFVGGPSGMGLAVGTAFATVAAWGWIRGARDRRAAGAATHELKPKTAS
jgi:hypothetical protein